VTHFASPGGGAFGRPWTVRRATDRDFGEDGQEQSKYCEVDSNALSAESLAQVFRHREHLHSHNIMNAALCATVIVTKYKQTLQSHFLTQARGDHFFQQWVKVKDRVLSRHMIHRFSPRTWLIPRQVTLSFLLRCM